MRKNLVMCGVVSAALLIFGTGCGSSGSSQPATGSTSGTASGTTSVTSAACKALQGQSQGVTGKSYTVAIDPEIADFSLPDPSNPNKIVGYNIDFMTAIANCLGITVKYLTTSFDGLIPALQSGRASLVDFNLVATAAREKAVNFVTYQVQHESFLVKVGNPQHITTLSDLCGTGTAVTPDSVELAVATAQSAACTKAGKPAVNVQIYPAIAGTVTAVANGRDASAILPDYIIAAAVKQYPTKLASTADVPALDQFIGFALPKSELAFEAALTKAIAIMQSNGTENSLFSRWHQTPSPESSVRDFN